MSKKDRQHFPEGLTIYKGWALPMYAEKGVWDLVVVMNDLEVETIMSCEGHKRTHDGLFPHQRYVEIEPRSYMEHREKLERVAYRLGTWATIHETQMGRNKRYFLVTDTTIKQHEVIKAFYQTWAGK